ncbi:hypothetical protein [Bartonella phoceensis]|uniref:hypothetical protein n=1 Tax=Bartonella phoceensis TaxID=270249 RepID=UPI001ABB5252|nr:hypothetical protein [Bartonella phoceensis]
MKYIINLITKKISWVHTQNQPNRLVQNSNNHDTINPHMCSVYDMLNGIAAEHNVVEYNPIHLPHAIDKKLKHVGSGVLLVIVQAQNLIIKTINRLRHLIDINGNDLAFVGNHKIFRHLVHHQNDPTYTQIKNHLAIHLKYRKPYSEDITEHFHDGEIKNSEAITFLLSIGLKDGVLHQIDKIMMLVYMAIVGDENGMKPKHIKVVWKNATWRN